MHSISYPLHKFLFLLVGIVLLHRFLFDKVLRLLLLLQYHQPVFVTFVLPYHHLAGVVERRERAEVEEHPEVTRGVPELQVAEQQRVGAV